MLFVGIAVQVATADESPWQIEVEPQANEAFEHVSYRLWLPPNVQLVRGILVFQHGCGYGASLHALRHTEDLQYRALAIKWGMALLAARQWAPGEHCGAWINPDVGTAGAFIRALSQFAARSGHPEIATVPWALWGHSGGGVWITRMTERYPDRVLAAFARSGAFGPDGPNDNLIGPGALTLRPSDKMRQVPMMFCFGGKEEPPGQEMEAFNKHLRDLYNSGAGAHSRWAIAIDPFAGHENANSRSLAIRFFDSVFTRSAGLGGAAAQGSWQGDPRSGAAAPASVVMQSSGDLKIAWLASEEFARSWQEFSVTGQIRDTSAPPAPTEVAVRPIVGGAVLSWSAVADIESGIGEFRIYGDGRLLGVQGALTDDPAPHDFQTWNYFDQPGEEEDQNTSRFAWRGALPKQFAVTVINHAGLESAPTLARPSKP